MNYGEYIKQRRTFLKITQVELGNFLHITPQGLSNYEKGKSKIPLSLVLDLCFYLKVSINDFFNLKVIEDKEEINLDDYSFDSVQKNIAYYREKSKLTLKEVSKKLGISFQRLSDFELSKASPSIEEFISLAKFYNVNFDEFFLKESKVNIIKPPIQNSPKKRISKYFYAGIAGFLAVSSIIAIAVPLSLNSSKPQQTVTNRAPSINKFFIKSEIDSSEETTELINNHDYYFFVILDNSIDSKITSLKFNEVTYNRKSFHEESTNKKVFFKFNSSLLNLGQNEISFNGFSYLNNNKEEFVSLNEETIKVEVLNDSIPIVTNEKLIVTGTSVQGNLLFSNDSNSILKDRKISLSIKKDNKIIQTIETNNNFIFNDLLPEETYELEASIFANFYDGKGETIHILFTKTFTTTPLVFLSSLTSSTNSVSYNFTINDLKAVKLNRISLTDKDTNKEVFKSTNLIDSIDGLTSNHNYILQVDVTHNATSSIKSYSYDVSTLIVDKPTIILDVTNLSEESFNITPTVNFSLNNFKMNSLKLISSKNDVVKEYQEVKDSYIFDNLLSNTIYKIEYSYSYDLLDGDGIINDTETIEVTTLKYNEPSMLFESLTTDETSIFFSLTETNEKIAPTYIKAELYKNNVLLETTTSRMHKFKNLESNYSHTLKIHFSYDLKDGNGTIYKTLTKNIITSSDIFIEDLRPGH